MGHLQLVDAQLLVGGQAQRVRLQGVGRGNPGQIRVAFASHFLMTRL